MRAVPLMLFALVAAMLLAGCISSIGSTQAYTNDYVSGLRTSVPVTDLANAVTCKDANCVCMVCEKGTSFFGFFTSLVGGHCYFDSQCDSAKFQSIANGTYAADKNLVPNYFRLGQGPSFADFGDANAWCYNRLGMAVQWLIGAPGSPYSLPAPRRAVCMLDKGVIPVYILYSKGQDVNSSQAGEIATILGTQGGSAIGARLPGPVGPVVVTTEINYNGSNATEVAQIKAQIRAINVGCNNDRDAKPPIVNCLVAVAPALGDYDALNAVMEDNPGTPNAVPDQEMNKSVDLVAYGIDSDKMNLSGYCNQPSIAWEAATAFSSYALYNLSKPSIIPYVIFDAKGTDASGTCPWTEASMINGYETFFNSYDQRLPALGVIGVAVYSFNSTSFGLNNPLGCNDCDVAKDPDRLRSWYGGCQAYVNLSRQITGGVVNYPSVGTLLRFPDQPSGAGSCQDDVNNIGSELANRAYNANGLQMDFFNPQEAPLNQPTTGTLFRCDACVSEKNTTPPFAFRSETGNVKQEYCTDDNPELDYFAGQRSLEPAYVRAVVATESTFDPCAAAIVTRRDPCFKEGYPSMTFPSSCNKGGTLPSGSAYCGLGLMQSLEPPIDYWPAQYQPAGKTGNPAHQSIYQSAVTNGLASDLSLAQACDPTNFNPFNATDSACVGTAKLAQKLEQARALVKQYHDEGELNWDPVKDVDKDNVFIAYVAANLYVGGNAWGGETWMVDYDVNGWNGRSGADCTGTDPVVFIQCRINQNDAEYPSPTVGDVGAKKMGYYYALRKICKSSQCPDWKTLYDAVNDIPTANGVPALKPVPPNGDPLLTGS